MPTPLGPVTVSAPLPALPPSFVGAHVFEEMAVRARQRGDKVTEEIALRNLHHLALTERARRDPVFAKKLWHFVEVEKGETQSEYPNEKLGVAEVYAYTANNGSSLPGQTVIRDGDNPDTVTNDADAKRVFWASKRDYLEFLKRYYMSNSMDGKGIDHYHSVHYGKDYNNAFMNGKQMAYGDGDRKNFNTFALPGVGIHENSHLRTQEVAGSEPQLWTLATQALSRAFRELDKIFSDLFPKQGHLFSTSLVSPLVLGGLIYRGQSGALNEHYSDYDAILVYLSQYAAGTRFEDLPHEAWLLGAGLFVRDKRPDGKTAALRSFLNELAYDDEVLGKDIQPKNMKDYYTGPRDSYGVHINSGIVNHASYLAFKNICELLDVDVPAAVEIQTAVWDKALKRMHDRTTFKEAADQWVKAAADLFPDKPQVKQAVQRAMEEVGILGNGAVQVDHVVSLWDAEDAQLYNVPEKHFAAADQKVNDHYATLQKLPGFAGAGVGARVKNGKVELVITVFVNQVQDGVVYPEKVGRFDVVVMQAPPLFFEPDLEAVLNTPIVPLPKNVRYLK